MVSQDAFLFDMTIDRKHRLRRDLVSSWIRVVVVAVPSDAVGRPYVVPDRYRSYSDRSPRSRTG